MNEGIFLLLGSNQGQPQAHLRTAGEAIARQAGNIVKVSAVYRSEPWGPVGQPDFYNQVMEIRSALAPDALLEKLLSIEQDMGRVRRARWGPRIIDIDILFYGDRVLHSDTLVLPHPGIPLRRFTLVPLAEIAGDRLHPLTGKTVREMLAACDDAGAVEKMDDLL